MADVQVIPNDLTGASPQFTGKAASLEDLAASISTSTSTLIGDLGVLASLSAMASALENYRIRVQTSMECFRTALQDAGQGLLETADTFVATDTQLAGTFTALGEQIYSGYDTPATGTPGLNGLPLITSPGGRSVIGLPSGLTGGSTILGGSSGLTPGVFIHP